MVPLLFVREDVVGGEGEEAFGGAICSNCRVAPVRPPRPSTGFCGQPGLTGRASAVSRNRYDTTTVWRWYAASGSNE